MALASSLFLSLFVALALTLPAAATCARSGPWGTARSILQGADCAPPNPCAGPVNPCGVDPNLVCTPGVTPPSYSCKCNPGLSFVGIPNHRGRCMIGSVSVSAGPVENEATRGEDGKWVYSWGGTFVNGGDVAVKDVFIRCTGGCSTFMNPTFEQLGNDLFALRQSFEEVIKPGDTRTFTFNAAGGAGENAIPPAVAVEVVSFQVAIFPVQQPKDVAQLRVAQSETGLTEDGSWNLHHINLTLTNTLPYPIFDVLLSTRGSLFPFRQYDGIVTLGKGEISALTGTFRAPIAPGQTLTAGYYYRTLRNFGQGPGPLPGTNPSAQQLAQIEVLSYSS